MPEIWRTAPPRPDHPEDLFIPQLPPFPAIVTILDGDRWTDAQGVTKPISELDTSHLEHLLPFLRRRAASIEFDYHMSLLSHPLGYPGGEMAQDAFDSAMDEAAEHPVRWLKGLPLYKRIEEELERRKELAQEATALIQRDWWEE